LAVLYDWPEEIDLLEFQQEEMETSH